MMMPSKDKATLKGYTAEDLSRRLDLSRPAAEVLRFLISEM